jgi:hypothetical protein
MLWHNRHYWVAEKKARKLMLDRGDKPDMGYFQGFPVYSDKQIQEMIDAQELEQQGNNPVNERSPQSGHREGEVQGGPEIQQDL